MLSGVKCVAPNEVSVGIDDVSNRVTVLLEDDDCYLAKYLVTQLCGQTMLSPLKQSMKSTMATIATNKQAASPMLPVCQTVIELGKKTQRV